MSIRRKILAWSSAGLLVAGMGVVVSATPIAPVTSASAATAPSCMHAVAGDNNVTVTNTCAGYKRAKAIFSYGRDAACIGYNPGTTYRSYSGSISTFDRLETC